MRLDRYITESRAEGVILDDGIDSHEDQMKAIATRIKKDCKYYLTSVNRAGVPIYRGLQDFQNVSTNELGVKKVHKNRKPRGMVEDLFVIFNRWLKANGHTTRNDSISVTANDKTVSQFGDLYVIFPLGKFDYSWVESSDVNYVSKDNKWQPWGLESMLWNEGKGRQDEWDEYNSNIFNRLIHTNEAIQTAIRKDFEIWMNPKLYYIITWDTYYDIKEMNLL